MPSFLFGGQSTHLLVEAVHVLLENIRMQEVPEGVNSMGEGHHCPSMPMGALPGENALLYECLVSCSDEPGSDKSEIKIPVISREGLGGNPASCSSS